MHWLLHDPLTRFIAQIVAVVVVSRLVGLIARRLEQPLVIAEVVAGIMLGPSLLGWVAPDALHALFPNDSMGTLRLVSQIGLILFMFLVGLELDPRLLRGRGHASVLISHTSIVVPFLLGVGLAFWLHAGYAPRGVPFLAFALFMGIAMSITAFPVLARILTDRNLLRTRIGAVAIACAAIDDVTAWCILAFVVAVARATDLSSAMLTTVLAVAYIVAMVFVVRPLLGRLSARVATPDALNQNLVAGVIVLVLLSSWGTELIGIHALFGAFLLGAIMPKSGGFARGLAGKLEDVVVVVLLPLFFAFSGLRTEIGLLDTAEHWMICGGIIVLACIGKFGGSAIPARLTGLPWREAGAVGILMNTRGLMELIVLNIGLDLGVITPTVFSMMVIMALVTTFMTTPLLERIYPMRLMKKDLMEPATPAVTGEIPRADDHRVLVCVAHAGPGPGLMTMTRMIATPPALLLHLVPSQRQSELLDQGQPDEPTEVLEPAREQAEAIGLPVRLLSFASNDPAEDICRVAAVRDAGLILLGWHKPVLSQTLLGGVVHQVMRDAATAVGVYVDRGLGEVRRVLVPFHGSTHDRAALGLAGRVQRATGAEVTILHVLRRGRRAATATPLADLVGGGGKVTVEEVENDSPEAAALDRCSDQDLLIVGVGREWGLGDRRFGLQPERLLHECRSSILVVRAAPSTARISTPLATARISEPPA